MAHVGRKRKRAIKTWSEQDLSWRHVTIWQPGMRHWIKRQTHKRERRQGKGDVREERAQWM